MKLADLIPTGEPVRVQLRGPAAVWVHGLDSDRARQQRHAVERQRAAGELGDVTDSQLVDRLLVAVTERIEGLDDAPTPAELYAVPWVRDAVLAALGDRERFLPPV